MIDSDNPVNPLVDETGVPTIAELFTMRASMAELLQVQADAQASAEAERIRVVEEHRFLDGSATEQIAESNRVLCERYRVLSRETHPSALSSLETSSQFEAQDALTNTSTPTSSGRSADERLQRGTMGHAVQNHLLISTPTIPGGAFPQQSSSSELVADAGSCLVCIWITEVPFNLLAKNFEHAFSSKVLNSGGLGPFCGNRWAWYTIIMNAAQEIARSCESYANILM